MNLPDMLGLALGLGMDALAVSVATGIVLKEVSIRQTLRLSFHFGLFQFLMPIAGWFAGGKMSSLISTYDHWVAFGLLAFIGGKMVAESTSGKKDPVARDPTRGLALLGLSLATSIDALAVGLSLGMLDVEIGTPSVVIGIVAASMTAAGMTFGKRLGERMARRMERAGGIVLIAIGIKILIEHLVGQGLTLL